MAMCGNGYRTAGMTPTVVHLMMAVPGCEVIVTELFCAAGLGALIQSTCVRLSVAGTTALSVTTLTAFVLPRVKSGERSE